MEKHTDGSMTLTKKEFAEVKRAYAKLYQILSDMPTFLGDFCDNRSQYLNIEKWNEQLQGREFNRSDFE